MEKAQCLMLDTNVFVDHLRNYLPAVRFFESLEGRVVNRLLSVREPKRSAFGQAVAQAYASAVYEFKQ